MDLEELKNMDKNEIKPILDDEEQLKIIVSDPELAVEFLKRNEVQSMEIEIEGEKIGLVRPLENESNDIPVSIPMNLNNR